MPRRTPHSGYSLSELLTVIAIIGLVVSIAVPQLGAMSRRAALRAAAGELRSIFHLARMRAISRAANCGVKFVLRGGEWQYAIYDDGDGDGIRNDDITRGVDRCVEAARPALRETRAVTIGLLDRTVTDPDGDRLAPSDAPVQFGRSTICSFSKYGESTAGTLYLTDRNRDLFAVRVYGASAKIRTLRYDINRDRWESR